MQLVSPSASSRQADIKPASLGRIFVTLAELRERVDGWEVVRVVDVDFAGIDADDGALYHRW